MLPPSGGPPHSLASWLHIANLSAGNGTLDSPVSLLRLIIKWPQNNSNHGSKPRATHLYVDSRI